MPARVPVDKRRPPPAKRAIPRDLCRMAELVDAPLRALAIARSWRFSPLDDLTGANPSLGEITPFHPIFTSNRMEGEVDWDARAFNDHSRQRHVALLDRAERPGNDGLARVTIEQGLGFAKLVSISAYRKGKGEYLMSPSADPLPSQTVFSPDAPNRMYSQELQLLSEPGPFKWVVGAYFTTATPTCRFRSALRALLRLRPGAPRRIDNFGKEVAESVAPFGQFDWEFVENTTLTGGVRWTYEKRSAVLSRG